jgi:hypothetical protein
VNGYIHVLLGVTIYTCVTRGNNFVSMLMVFRLDFGTVLTVWYILYFILLNISNSSVVVLV